MPRKRKPTAANDNDKQYAIFGDNGRPYDWFMDGIMDWIDGRETDMGIAVGKRLKAAERCGRLTHRTEC
jgi:hypothetical protein